MTIHTCPDCGRVFDTELGLRTHYGRVHNGNLPNRVCSVCQTEFYAEHEKKYCSEECLHEGKSYSGADNPNYSGGKSVGTCELCDDDFEFYPSEKDGVYCSNCVENVQWRLPPKTSGPENPQWKGGKRDLECAVCGESVKRYPSNVSEVTVCGHACRRQWLSDSFTGDGHPNWKGGGNGSYGKGWNSVRRNALERDGYQCVVCGSSKAEIGRNPDVHHIVPVRSFIESVEHTREDAHFLDNVVSLCISCHRKADFGKISRDRLRALTNSEE